MTKEELKQEAEEWVQNNNYPYSNCPNIEKKLKEAYLAGAEPREKRIAEIEKEVEEYIDKLTKDWSDGEYSFSVEELRQAILHFAEPREKRIAELEAQIEKMKCCENCADYDGQDCDADNENYCRCFTGDKNDDCYWRLKED